jgi:glutamate-1-semialdehyde 2,1-aminomutase
MAMLAPFGPVYQAGTLSGNPVATAAGLATLRGCTPEVYDRLGVVSTAIAGAASEALSAAGVPHVVQWAGSMFSVFFREGEVRNYDDAKAQNPQAFTAFFHSLLSQGVHLPPSAFESWFVSASHDDAAVDRVVSAMPAAARAVTDSFATLGS